MSWAAVAAAGVTAAGSLLGGSEQTYTPRRATKNAERDRLTALNSALYGYGGRPGLGVNPNAGTGQGGFEQLFTDQSGFPQYPQNAPFSQANPYELASIQGLGDFATQAFPQMFGATANAGLGALGGDSRIGGYADSLSQILPQLQSALGAPPQVQNPGFDPSQFTGMTQGLGADPTNAINSMMGGNLDTSMFQGAIDSYLQPAMEQFNEQIMPSLLQADSMATGGQSSAGALKAAQRVQEQIGEGLGAHLGGRLFDASQNAANRVGQGAGLALNQQGVGLQGLGLAGNLAGQASQFDLSSQLANQGAYSDWTRNLLGGVGLGAGSAEADATNQARWASMMPNIAQMGMMGPQALAMAGTAQRGLTDPFLQHQFNAQMYNQQVPFDMANNWYGMLTGAAPNIAGSTQEQGGSGTSALVAGLGSLLGNWPSGKQGTAWSQPYDPSNPYV